MVESSRPNILVLLTDQLRADILPAYGGSICQTPVLDRLAAESTVFTRAYTPTAVCSPARASILTGQYPHNHGVTGNHDNQITHGLLPDSPDLLSRRLERLGYDRYYLGKWHLGDETNLPRDVGLPGQQFSGHGDGGHQYPEYREYLSRKGLSFGVQENPGRVGSHRYGVLEGPEEAEVSAFLVEETLDFLDDWTAREARDPFFCWVNFWGPHEPYFPTADYLALYDGVEIPPWPNVDDRSTQRPAVHQLKVPPESRALGWEYWEPAVRHYFAFMSLIDHQMGRILDKLEEMGELENTIVVFSADHGESLGAHDCQDKGHFMYEEIYRIPLIIRTPGQRPGREHGLVSTVDLCPTILDWAGDPDPAEGRDGRSLLPLLDGAEIEWRTEVVSEFHGLVIGYTQRMITDERYKYVWNVGDLDEFYDLRNDPYELHNLVGEVGAADDLARLRHALRIWMDETGDEAIEYYGKYLDHAALG